MSYFHQQQSNDSYYFAQQSREKGKEETFLLFESGEGYYYFACVVNDWVILLKRETLDWILAALDSSWVCLGISVPSLIFHFTSSHFYVRGIKKRKRGNLAESNCDNR
jgi:hypothetical protein